MFNLPNNPQNGDRVELNGCVLEFGNGHWFVLTSGIRAINIPVDATPTNYFPANDTIEAHLAAIDAALGAL